MCVHSSSEGDIPVFHFIRSTEGDFSRFTSMSSTMSSSDEVTPKQIEDPIFQVGELTATLTVAEVEDEVPITSIPTENQLPGFDGLRLPSQQHANDNELTVRRLHQGQLGTSLQETAPETSIDPFQVRQLDYSEDLHHLDEQIANLKEAVSLLPNTHSEKPEKLNTLGNCFSDRFERLGELSDIGRAIVTQEEVVKLVHDDVAKAGYLNNLACFYYDRFQRLWEHKDIDKAIIIQQQAVDLAPDSHAIKTAYLNNLGNSFRSRFVHLREITDIDKSIAAHQKAINLAPDGHTEKSLYLNHLGMSFICRFEHLGEPRDIEKAILAQQKAVDLTSNDHSDWAEYLDSLGYSVISQFTRLGEITKVDKTISPTISPDSSVVKPTDLNSVNDTGKAIAAHPEAVDLTPGGHTHRARYLSNLGLSFSCRFRWFGDFMDINKAISLQEQAVSMIPDDLGELIDIHKAIAAGQEAVNLISDSHPDKAEYLDNLGSCLCSGFERLKEITNIDMAVAAHQKAAIAAQQEAVDLIPDGHAAKPSMLISLGHSFNSRFGQFGKLTDIDKAIALGQEAVNLTPNGHAMKAGYLSSLGSFFSNQFFQLAELSDIDKAISAHQKAVGLTPDGHIDKPVHLRNLGSSFDSRFGQLKELADIDRSIAAQQEAVNLITDNHVAKSTYLASLGVSYCSRYNHLGELIDIDKAIAAGQKAVNIIPDSHPGKSQYLSNLGNSFLSHAYQSADISDIDEAIIAHQNAVNLTPSGHIGKPGLLNSLGISLAQRYILLRQPSDIDKAIDTLQQAVNLIPDGHATMAQGLGYLGMALQSRLKQSHKLEDFERSLDAYCGAAKNNSSNPSYRYNAAQHWASLASAIQMIPLALEAYKVLLEIVPQRVWIGQKVTRRYQELSDIGSVINAAAAMAITSGNLTLALEWLEEGRSIVWGQILQLHTPVDELHLKYPEYAEQLSKVSGALADAGISRNTQNIQEGDLQSYQLTLEEEAQTHHALAAEYSQLIEQIHTLEGFNDFLQPKKLSELVHVAKNGPVAVINVHESRCDALVLHSHDTSEPIIHVPLPQFSQEKAEELFSQMNLLLKTHNVRDFRKLELDEDSIPNSKSKLTRYFA
ncbi:hypothetical protein M422DRAFT_255581 [Sphaerobolus stellatus SS14]|uniref:CHAT domain-containing protein n=1 Tax=Sphaerobolus stellatus (strain SS14) TaxID=990650 RepID=A0A0C9VSH6_SPHS4|nr:hypothetical protein M422DRAFT_255576 [Sphaerobolus stellatus SS14]KIJ41390.1 hypothetical protein M422DRAFT_255581 [Sphaerobolus stellatus SS14]